MNIQRLFPQLNGPTSGKRFAYLDSGATTLKLQSVIDRMNQYLAHETSNVHRGIYALSENNTRYFEEVRHKVQHFIKARHPHEIIFTKGTTESLNLVAQSYARAFLMPGDSILLSAMEHHSNIVPWQMVALEKKLNIKVIPINALGEILFEAFEKMLTPDVKLLSFTMVSNTLGSVTPYAEMVKLAKSKGIIVSLDGAQAVSHFALDVQALDCDFLSFSAHKLFGPNALGVLYGKEELLNKMPPFLGGGNMIQKVTFEKTTYNQLPEKFEAGTPAIAEVLGFGPAIDFMNEVGFGTIHKIDHELNDLMTKELGKLDNVILHGQAKNKVGIFGFNLKGAHPHDVGSILDQEGVCVRTGHHCTQPIMQHFGVTHMIRASLSLYNTPEDIYQLVEGLKKAQKLLL